MSLLTEEHDLVRKTVVEFVERHVRPNSRRIDSGWYPLELLREMGRLGLLAPTAPPEYGGPGADYRAQAIVVEELGRASPSLATIAEIQGSMNFGLIYRYGSEELKERWLERLATGQAVSAFALSEPCCGSDAAAIETAARREGGEWRISGTKLWITSGLYADLYLVFARTGRPEERHRAITAFAVERGDCVAASPIALMGLRGSGTAEVKLSECAAGDDQVLGQVNKGFYLAMEAINYGRLSVGALGLGIAREAMAEAREYVARRRAFGRQLSEFQAVRHAIAGVLSRAVSVRLVVYEAARLADAGEGAFAAYAQVAKLEGSRLAVDATRTAMQLMGGYGYSTDSHVEMLYRDAKITEIYEGANELVLDRIYTLAERDRFI